ncbi:MAG: hypothetical protein QOF70_6262 [Acetobacteraceae bacterium]|jgi:hypothetical protein|nr:hypothetical protein [Acetobacteraceae bacterium]
MDVHPSSLLDTAPKYKPILSARNSREIPIFIVTAISARECRRLRRRHRDCRLPVRYRRLTGQALHAGVDGPLPKARL